MNNSRVSTGIVAQQSAAPNVLWVDSDRLRISFTTLVIDARAIVRAIGSIHAFLKRFELPLKPQTNGHLVAFSEMSFPGEGIYHIIANILKPLGMRDGVDYRIIQEQPSSEASGMVGKVLPGTEELRWLAGRVEVDGCFVAGV